MKLISQLICAMTRCYRGRQRHMLLQVICSGILTAVICTILYKATKHSRPAFPSASIITEHDFNVIVSILPKLTQDSQCVSPQLPLYNDFIHHNRPKVIPADLCDSQPSNWLHVSQSKVYLKPKLSDAKCSAEPIYRVNDHESKFGKSQPIHNGSELPSLGFRATCTAHGVSHESVYYGINRISAGQHAAASKKVSDNIIILGIDSISRLESLRSLPRVSELMRTQLNAVTLAHYNILGDGTPAALLPILTGVREQDMPEGRQGFKTARHLDETMRWIFQDLREQGFVTAYGEEGNSFGTFQLRFVGFKQEPVHFYLRPVLLQQEKLHKKNICIGNEISSARMLQTVKDLFTLYPNEPKFAFLFFSAFSHENQDLTLMDSELSKFVQWFARESLIRNTTLIFMSDHGQRHGPMRNSMQGKLEESLPLMTIALSHNLVSHRSDAAQLLEDNTKRLTTPLDIHKTLLSIAGIRRWTSDQGQISAYSLIDEPVPERRSCSNAGIPTHWCACLSRVKVSSPKSDLLAIRAAEYAVNLINTVTGSQRRLCAELHLEGVVAAEVSLASSDMAKRQRIIQNYYAVNVENADLTSSGYVTVRFVTAPSDGLYEATLLFSLLHAGDQYGVEFSPVGEASRINRYGSQADCVAREMPHLRKFCFCLQA